MTAWGQEAYQTPFEKAAAMAESIVRNHPFNDANHRTALAAVHLTLGLHGLRLAALPDAQKAPIRELGAGTLTLEAFAKWLEQNSALRTPPTGFP
jgi:death-on-curing protein